MVDIYSVNFAIKSLNVTAYGTYSCDCILKVKKS